MPVRQSRTRSRGWTAPALLFALAGSGCAATDLPGFGEPPGEVQSLSDGLVPDRANASYAEGPSAGWSMAAMVPLPPQGLALAPPEPARPGSDGRMAPAVGPDGSSPPPRQAVTAGRTASAPPQARAAAAGSPRGAAQPPSRPGVDTGPAGQPRQISVSFAGGSVELDDAAKTSLAGLARSLQQAPQRQLQLVAYAGSAAPSGPGARRLALLRALAVRSFLIESGVQGSRLTVKALGSSNDGGPPDRVDLVPS